MPNPTPLKRQSSSCVLYKVSNEERSFALVQQVKSIAEDPARGKELLENLALGMLSKTKMPSIKQLMLYNYFAIKILEVIPQGEPSWGVLRKCAQAFLANIFQKDLAKAWDEKILADQFSTLLFSYRKLLRDPDLVNRTLTHLDDNNFPEWKNEVLQMLELFDENDNESCASGLRQNLFTSEAEESALQTIEQAEEAPPQTKFRYHQALKKEKERKELLKSLDEEIKMLQSFLQVDEGGEGPRTPKRIRVLKDACSQKKEKVNKRRYLPHKDLGELQLTKATGKSYICYKMAGSSETKTSHTFLIAVYGKGEKGSPNHQDVCEKLFEEISAKNLSLTEAKELRTKLIQS